MEDDRLEQRVHAELQKPHPVGIHLKELRSNQSASEFYTREHVARLLKYEAVRPWGRERRQKKVLCSSVHPPGCKQCQTCHFCRQKTTEPKTYCKCAELKGRRLLAGRGRGYWCGPCLEMRIGENIDEVNQNQDWTCPICRDICNCSSVNCIRAKSGLDFTNQLWHEANSNGYKSVAHYLILTHVKETGSAMPMVDLSGVRARRPETNGSTVLPALEVAQGRQRQRKGSGRAWRAQQIDSVSSKTCEQVTLEFKPPESLALQDNTWKAAMQRLRADFEVADGLEDDDVDAAKVESICRGSFLQGGVSTGGGSQAPAPPSFSLQSDRSRPAAAAHDASSVLGPASAVWAAEQQLTPGGTGGGASGAQGASSMPGAAVGLGQVIKTAEAMEAPGTAGPHPGLPALGAADISLAGSLPGARQSSGHGFVQTGQKRTRVTAPSSSAAGRVEPSAHGGHRQSQQLPHTSQNTSDSGRHTAVEQAGSHLGAEQTGAGTDASTSGLQGTADPSDTQGDTEAAVSAPPPTASDRRSFFWELHDLVLDWPMPEDDEDVMEDLDREVLRFLPWQSVAVTQEHRPSEVNLDSTPSMSTHSDLRACSQVLLRLPAILPEDQVEHQVVRRLFGYEPFLDFGGSDSVARAVLMDAAVNLIWQQKKAGKDYAEVAGYLLDFVEMLLTEAATVRDLLAQAETYCGLTTLEAVEVGHLTLQAVGLSQMSAADDRIIALQTLMEGNQKLVTLLLQHIFALCAHGDKNGVHVFLEDRLGFVLQPGAPVTHEQRSLVLMIMMALMDNLVPGPSEEITESKRQAATTVLARISDHLLRRVEVLVAIDNPARQKAGDELELLPPDRRQQLTGLGGQSIMVLGRVFGLKVAYGLETWAELETYAISPCKRSTFWEHSRPVHRNFALKLLGFALQAMPSGPITGHEVRVALLRHWLRAVLERPHPNGATRLFVKMVTMQPWLEQMLSHQGGWAWETSQRAAAFRRVLDGYSSDREQIMDGLLQFLMNREAEVISEAADIESSTDECCRWVASTAPVLISCIQALGARELHNLLPNGGARQGAARGSVLSGVLEQIVGWIPPSVAALCEAASPSQQSSLAQDQSQLLQLARRRVRETVISQLGGLLEILLDLGAPACFQQPLRPSTDPILRLLSVVVRSILELTSGSLTPGPADEVLLEQLAKAASPDQGDEPQSQSFRRKTRLLHFVLSVYGADFLESSRVSMAFCTRTAVNMLNFTSRVFDQTSLRGLDAVLQLVPPLLTPIITALAPNSFDGKERSVMVAHAVFSLFQDMLKTHPGLVVPPPTGEEDPVDGVPYQGGPLQTGEQIEPRRFQAVMQIFTASLLEAVVGSVAAAVGAPSDQASGSQTPLEPQEIGQLTAESAKGAQWELSKLLGRGRLLAESYREENVSLKGMQRAPIRVRSALCVPSGMELRAAKQGLGLLLQLACCQEAGAQWAHRALPVIRQCLVEHSAPQAPIRLEFARVLVQMPATVAEQYRLDTSAVAAASSVASRPSMPGRSHAVLPSAETRPASSTSAPGTAGASRAPACEEAAGFALSQATQPYNPLGPSQAAATQPPDSRAQIACVPLGEALRHATQTPIRIQGVVTARKPEDRVGTQDQKTFLSLHLRDQTAQVSVMCVGELAVEIHRLLTPQQMQSAPVIRMFAARAKGSVMRARGSLGTAALNPEGSESLRQWFSE